ncbi:MAG: hypothetical protein LQ352_000863 [Teloschistes flavicans]|nr:MAG: hypothetical protein LQ352_000863 [Teloschistes flavicans]
MRLLESYYVFSFFLLHHVWGQSQNPTTTESPPNEVTVISSAPFPTATGPQCETPRGPSDPSASDIAEALSADNTVSKACSVETQTTDTIGNLIVISYGIGDYFFNVSHSKFAVSAPIASPNQCPDSFNAILEQCVTGTGNSWGGSLRRGAATYSITNLIYPENPLAQQAQPSVSVRQTINLATHTSNPSAAARTTNERPTYTHTDDEGTTQTGSGTSSIAKLSTTTFKEQITSTGDAKHTTGTQSGAAHTTGEGEGGQETGNHATSTQPAGTFTQRGSAGSGTGAHPQNTPKPLPFGATVIVSTISGTAVTETFIPTTYSQYASLLTKTSITSINSNGITVTTVLGPGGVAWVPYSPPTAGPLIQPTDAPFGSVRNRPTTSGAATTAAAGAMRSQGIVTSTTAKHGTTGAVLAVITTPFDAQAATLTSVDPVITGNTAISTGDGSHQWGLYPFIHGGSHCLWCPPGLDHGGIVLWGITKPGIYDDIEPPIPGIVEPLPEIVVGEDLVPTANEESEDERPSNTREEQSKPTQTQPTKTHQSSVHSTERSTGSCTASSVVQDCDVICNDASTTKSCSTTCTSSTIPCSGHGTTVTSVQTGACERPSPYSTQLAPVTEPSKGLGRGSVLLPGGGGRTTGVSRTMSSFNVGTGTAQAGTKSVGSTNGKPTSSGSNIGGVGNTLVTTKRTGTSTGAKTTGGTLQSTTAYVPPAWQCPNDGVRQNAPGCPTPTTSTGGPLKCSTGSNLGLDQYSPATWCGCNGQIYFTISGATSDYCAYKTVPSETVLPTKVPNPYPFTITNSRNGEVTACATSSVDTSKSTTACDGESTIVSTVTAIAAAASASAAAAVPTANCDFWDEVLYWNFEVYNVNGWAGNNGDSLHQQEKGCGGLTGWSWHVDNERYQHAYFNLPFTIKSGCAERAIASAGGPSGLKCTGHGLKKRDSVSQDTPKSKNLRSRRYGRRTEHRFSYQGLDDSPLSGASSNISSRAIVPRAHTDAWNKYAPKGIQYYNEWKNRAADQEDKAALCNFDQTYDFSQDPLSVTGPYDSIKPYINGAKGQTYTNFRWHYPKGPTNQATAIFWNNISPVDNAIIAFSNDRGGDEEEGEDPSPDNWSDMLWWLWLRATSEAGDASALSQIFRYNVDNDASKEILQEILGDKEDEVVTLEPDDAQSQDNGFWALLGCPNGTGMIHIVGDHKKALGGKGIRSISCIYNRSEDQYYMWGNLG